MAHRAWRVPGEPDFQIFGDGGRVWMIECKSRTGKLSTDQLGVQMQARKLGHAVHVVRSMDEFRKVVEITGPEADAEANRLLAEGE